MVPLLGSNVSAGARPATQSLQPYRQRFLLQDKQRLKMEHFMSSVVHDV